MFDIYISREALKIGHDGEAFGEPLSKSDEERSLLE
jgi:hypothetical protein